MLWHSSAALAPSLPAHCEPTNDFLLRFSAAFHICIPTPLAFISNALGLLSITSWLFAQLPQIYKNWSISSTSGLSFFFLLEWCLGDTCNLLGALFTHQASWQVAIGSYYVFVDLCLVSQWLWYEKLKHGRRLRTIQCKNDPGPHDWSRGEMNVDMIEGREPSDPSHSANGKSIAGADQAKPNHSSKPQIIFRAPGFDKHLDPEEEKRFSSLSATPSSTAIHRVGPSSPMPSPSPRTILLIACLAAIVQASPVKKPSTIRAAAEDLRPTPLENAGTIISWMSTFLYLGSRVPQLVKNWQRQSTAGLSPQLFAAAFCGNLFYSLALVTNPRAWHDFDPYGGGGWVGSEGSDRNSWIAAALPFFLGAAGVLGLDASVGVQFLLYGEPTKVVVVEEGRGRRRRWRRVSGWMRGWIPSISESKVAEREALLSTERHREGYGAS